jgi:hypothetical protein
VNDEHQFEPVTLDELYRLANDTPREILTAAAAAVEDLQQDAQTWPNVAAALTLYGELIAGHGRTIAAALADYAEHNPTPAPAPDGRVSVLLIGREQHQRLWSEAAEATRSRNGGQLAAPTAEDYRNAFEIEHGRPDVDVLVELLDKHDHVRPVLVIQHVPGAPDQRLQVQIGGWTKDAHYDRIEALLSDRGIEAGPPAYWAPVPGQHRFLSIAAGGQPGLFDHFGRAVELVDPGVDLHRGD